jgi:hypothetical protein
MVAYPDNFNEIINLAIRLDDSFKRLKHAQKEPGKKMRNPIYKKKKDPNTMDWQASDAFKKDKKISLKREKERSHKVTLNTLTVKNKDIMRETAILL